MALISIGGVDLPSPSTFDVGYQDISKSERNANGTMIAEFIARKVKIELRWKYLSADDIKTVLNAIDPFFFDVTYLDPHTGGNITKTFYKGDRNVPMMDFRSGIPRYKDFAFNIVER